MKLNLTITDKQEKILKYLMPTEDLDDYFQRQVNAMVNNLIKINYQKDIKEMETELEEKIDAKNK